MKATLDKVIEDGMDAVVSFRIPLREMKDIPEGELSLTVKKWRNPRSRDALNFSWQIVTDIANEIGADKDETYKMLVNDYGELERDGNGQLIKLVVKDTVDPMELDLYLHKTEHTTEIQGTLYRLYWVVKPPHEYDTKEFARFIDCLIKEARDIGIEVDYTR